MFKVEKGISLVPVRSHGRTAKYPWLDMEVGDSFFVPDGIVKSIGSLASGTSKRLGRKFAVRSVEGGTRVWRIE